MKVEMKTIRKSFFKIVEIKNNTIKTVNPQIRVANEGGDNNKLEEMPIGSSKTAMQKEKKKTNNRMEWPIQDLWDNYKR